MRRNSAAAALLIGGVLVLLAGCGGGRAASSEAPTADGSRVILIMLENHGYDEVIGNPEAPYLNQLAGQQALATDYYAETHPSLPNYLALLGGSTFGIESDCTECRLRAHANLATQLSAANFTWRAYMEEMPQACSGVSSAGDYVKKHDPFMYFPSIANDPKECAKVVPGDRLSSDLGSGRLPAFSWISPNLCNDGHNCGIGGADHYLSDVVPGLLDQLGPQGFLAITFDEDGGADRQGERSGGGRIPAILAGPTVRHGARVASPFDHYSLLRTIEAAFGQAPLRKANSAHAMRAAFARFPKLRPGGAGDSPARGSG